MRERRLPAVIVKNTVCMWTLTIQLYVYEQCIPTRHELYFDAKGSGLRAGGLSGGSGGLRGGLEQGFEDGLGVHLWGRLRGGSLTGGAREGRGHTVFFCAIACAWSVTEPPVGAKEWGGCQKKW